MPPSLKPTGPLCPGYALRGDAAFSPGRMWLLALFGVVATVLLAFVAGAQTLPLHLRDNQHYFYITERVAAGVPPHVSGFDPKNTLPLLLSGAGVFFGDMLGLAPVVAVRVISIATLALFNGLLGALLYRTTGSFVAGVLATAFGLAYANPMAMAAIGARPKLLLLLLFLLTTWAVHRRAYPLAAFLSALCFISWQPTLLIGAVVFLVAVIDGSRLRTLVLAAAAAVVPVAAYEAYYWLAGGLREQLFQCYEVPSTYMSHGMGDPLVHLASVVEIWLMGYGRFHPAPILAGLALVVCWYRMLRSPGTGRVRRWDPGWLFLHLATYAVVAFTIYDHQGPPDLYLLLPFMSVFASIGLAELVQVAGRGLPPRVSGLAVGLFVLATLGLSVRHHLRWGPDPGWTLADQERAASTVGSWVDAGETVYAVNAAHLLGMARRDNWLPYTSFFRGVNTFLRGQTDEEAFVPRGPDGSLPSRILVGAGRPFGWPEWLESSYAEVTPPEFAAQGISVWSRLPTESR